MKKLLLLAFILCATIEIQAQTVSTRVDGDATLTNSLILNIGHSVKLFSVTGYNNSGVTEYIQIFQTNAIPASGATAKFSNPVAPNAPYFYDFSWYGADLSQVTVCVSTNYSTIGLAPANCSIQTITRL